MLAMDVNEDAGCLKPAVAGPQSLQRGGEALDWL